MRCSDTVEWHPATRDISRHHSVISPVDPRSRLNTEAPHVERRAWVCASNASPEFRPRSMVVLPTVATALLLPWTSKGADAMCFVLNAVVKRYGGLRLW